MWNLFEYVDGKPTVLTDPMGLGFFDPPLPSPGGFPLLQKLNALCKKCAEPNKLGYCLQRANRVAYSIKRVWRSNFGRGPATMIGVAVGGYYCYEWANVFHEVGKKCGGSHITSEVVVIRQVPRGQDHVFTRFCAGDDRGKQECCVDVDDGFSDGDFCHPAGEMENDPDWELSPNQKPRVGTPIPLGIR